MNDHYNQDTHRPNEGDRPVDHTANTGQQDAPEQTPQSTNNGQPVWSVPPQSGTGYQPPYQTGSYEQSAPQRESDAQQQYSTTNGWQQSNNTPSPHSKGEYRWNFDEYAQAQAAKAPKQKSKGPVVFFIIIASVLAVSLISFAGIGIYSLIAYNDTQITAEQSPSIQTPVTDLPGITLQDKPQEEGGTLLDGKLTTEQIVEKVQPSIVAITTYVNYQNYQAEGMGSGIIIREDGYIVTNAHVVEGARGITVTLSDGQSQYEGRIIGSDIKTDLAVIKIDAAGLPAASFGNSDQTKVGEKVIAIGNPQSMDFAGSVTQGIVSGLNRTLTAGGENGGPATTYSSLIQTDAAINPGNSGGALVNEYGQIIGINSAKVIKTGAEGMGFAIPASSAKPIVDDLIQHGRVTGRVRLGIMASAVDEVLARLNNVPTGLLVQSTEQDSDISRKGVIPGDIITKVDGNDINSFQSLTSILEGKKPGDKVELEVYRPAARAGQNGRFFNVSVKLLEDMGDATVDNQQENQPYEGYSPQNPETQPPANEQVPDSYKDIEDFFNHFFN